LILPIVIRTVNNELNFIMNRIGHCLSCVPIQLFTEIALFWFGIL